MYARRLSFIRSPDASVFREAHHQEHMPSPTPRGPRRQTAQAAPRATKTASLRPDGHATQDDQHSSQDAAQRPPDSDMSTRSGADEQHVKSDDHGGHDHHSAAELPSPGDGDDDDDGSSFLRERASFLERSDAQAAAPLHSDAAHSVDEREMRRHLMDVESSFLPEPMPAAPAEDRLGTDDTYMNMGSPRDQPPVSQILGLPTQSSPPAPAGASRDELADVEEEEHSDHTSLDGDDDNATRRSEQDLQHSSPAARAAERTHSRNVSAESEGLSGPVDQQSFSISFDGDDEALSQRSGTRPRVAASRSTLNAPPESPQPQDFSLPPSDATSSSLLQSANGYQSLSPRGLRSRPSHFMSRNSTHRSTMSAADAEIAFESDYALQTGGAVPADTSFGSRSAMGLSRLPSLGSVASVMSRDSDGGMPSFNRAMSGASVLANLRAERGLDRLEEEDRSSSALSDPMTPRPATASTFSAPTDTVIAQHVQNIYVPDTIAKEYRQRNRSFSPDKRPSSSSKALTFQGRPRTNLTLKEQNSKIDKLTKENFDLKLKIHFLDQALQDRSDEGVKDMISKNVQYQTDLANERKDSQSLRRKIKDLERRLREKEDELAQARSNAEADEAASREELEIEITHLSEELDRLQVRITRLSAENMSKEIEKRKMTEYIAALNDRKGSEQNAVEEESEMWKDLLTTETARREQAEEDIRKLREELIIVRSDKTAETNSRNFNLNRFVKRTNVTSRSMSGDSEGADGRSVGVSASSATAVEQQLRHENAELRRDLGAQTSMLTSRNKERERLQQEIEDLKMSQRKGSGSRSVAGDSIFERSISRQHQRPASRASGQTGMTQMSEAERDEWVQREGNLRDQNASLRLDNQDLERELQARAEHVAELEQVIQELESDLNSAANDMRVLQQERNNAMQAIEQREIEAQQMRNDYNKLKEEAVTAIDEYETDLEKMDHARGQLESDLKDRNDDFVALQRELRELNNSLMQLEDDRTAALKRIETLEQELDQATQELTTLDKDLREANQKNQRLEVQQESLHSEISFLREEQEGDKIRIGDLENSLNAAQQSIHDEREKMQELEESLVEERRQREIVDNQSKQEVQKVLNELNAENSKSKDEVRRLRRGLSTKEVEASTFKNRLEELENNLRRALGDFNGKRTSWLQEIERLQNDLEQTVQDLETTRGDLVEKDRLLRNRDMLLESSGLESRRLSDLLDKERQARKHDLHQYEQSHRGHSTHARTIAQHESRVLELETSRSQDRRKMAVLEQQYRDQLVDRNNLLLALWNRLSTLCGSDWAQSHSLVNGEVPSIDVIARSLPGFNRNIIEAVKAVESLIGSFKTRIRAVEKSMSKDYQTLSQNLDVRIKRMDFLERAVKDAQAQIDAQAQEHAQLRLQQTSSKSTNTRGTDEITKLKQEVKVLKAELKFQRQHPGQRTQEHKVAETAESANRRGSSVASTLSPRGIANSLLRHHSSSAVDTLQNASNNAPANIQARNPIVIASPPIQPSEQRWIHRLKELERRLKAEREARLLDRRGARQRLEEGKAENEELKAMLEREKIRRGSMFDEAEESIGPEAGRGRQREGSVD
ncbi:hypothetical protein MBLNU459_g2587t1 [Dothideomycetes sp. NU459]